VGEVPFTGENHGDSGLVRRIDYLAIAHRSSRLINRSAARVDRGFQAIFEREERIGRARTTGSSAICLFSCNPASIATVLLPSAYPDSLLVLA